MKTILEIQNLHTNYYTDEGIVRAANGLDLSVGEGEFVALVGESGCGKSQSAMAVLGLIPTPPGIIEEGKILFRGEDLLEYPAEKMRMVRGGEISIIFQEPMTSLNPTLTIGRQLTESLMLHKKMSKKEAWEEATHLLSQVGIPDPAQRMKDYPSQFSGGMRQRIMIVMAISCKPTLLIADEPTTALDVTVQAQILEILDNLRREYHTAILMITHNLGIVSRYADSVNVMYAGRVVESAPTTELYHYPMHPYTKGLLASVPRLDRDSTDDLRAIPGTPPNLAKLPAGCSFCPRCKYKTARCEEEVPVFTEERNAHYRACFCPAETLLAEKVD